jgi:hypothetical protein
MEDRKEFDISNFRNYDEGIVALIEPNSAPKLCKRKDSPFTLDFDHIALDGLTYMGYQLGMYVQGDGANNPVATTILKHLKFQFTIIKD